MTRHADLRLANFTVCFLGFYVPFETWFSWPALTDPFYLVDFIGMALLAWGAVHVRRSPTTTPGVLAAGWAWSASNFWRAFFGRVEAIRGGEQLDLGLTELCIVGGGLGIAVVCLAIALVRTRDTR
jgi:hypothetical protein